MTARKAEVVQGVHLDRCPFDGETVQLFHRSWPYSRWWVKCQCGARSPERNIAQGAADWWNRRSDHEDWSGAITFTACGWCARTNGHDADCPNRPPVDTGRLRDSLTVKW